MTTLQVFFFFNFHSATSLQLHRNTLSCSSKFCQTRNVGRDWVIWFVSW